MSLTEEELSKMRALGSTDAAASPDAESGSEASSEGSQPEEKVKPQEESDDVTGTSEPNNPQGTVVEEHRVPYSRFETVNERAVRAEAELELLKEQLTKAQSQPTYQDPGELPADWVELYGDTEASKRAWIRQQDSDRKRFAALEETAVKKAVESLQKVQSEAAAQEAEATQYIGESFDDYLGKNKKSFSEKEQEAILDIVDGMTPVGEDGKYVADPTFFIPKAVELYELRKAHVEASKKASRRDATQLVGANSDSSHPTPVDTFRSGDWDSWRNNPMLPKESNN